MSGPTLLPVVSNVKFASARNIDIGIGKQVPVTLYLRLLVVKFRPVRLI